MTGLRRIPAPDNPSTGFEGHSAWAAPGRRGRPGAGRPAEEGSPGSHGPRGGARRRAIPPARCRGDGPPAKAGAGSGRGGALGVAGSSRAVRSVRGGRGWRPQASPAPERPRFRGASRSGRRSHRARGRAGSSSVPVRAIPGGGPARARAACRGAGLREASPPLPGPATPPGAGNNDEPERPPRRSPPAPRAEAPREDAAGARERREPAGTGPQAWEG